MSDINRRDPETGQFRPTTKREITAEYLQENHPIISKFVRV